MAITYPLHSDVPRESADQRRDIAKRHGYASCVQWRNTTGLVDKPTNPYLKPYNDELADAWEEGWTTAVASLEGRHY